MKRANKPQPQEREWSTRPISATCERIAAVSSLGVRFCDDPTSYAYPAAGGGWCALCFRHGQKHLPRISTIEELITAGEKFAT